jgi:aerobic-type carbon monoxide dehydrogenase small subunit (CoxS/CutS family)
MKFFVNGKQVTALPDREATLLDFLRDTLRLMGTKNGCGTGHCGACTVILDGEARRACQVRLVKMDGRRIETIEGLASEGRLHPIQSAFIETGAIQCGFCTPGMILSATNLLQKNPKPSEEEIRTALSGNLCRCTGYQKIVEAIQSVGERDQG